MPRLVQNTLTPLWEMKKIKGIDNVASDDLRLEPGFVRVCENVDISDAFLGERRNGVLQRILDGVGHSGWTDGNKLCFLVLDNDLVQLHTNWSITTLITGVGSSPMNFLKADERVFFSNLIMCGYIQNGTAYAFPEEEIRTGRQRMVGGSLIEFIGIRFYVAQNGFIYRSVAQNPFEMDIARDFIYLGGPITMMKGVNGPGGEIGLYVSAEQRCVYLSNLEPSLEGAHYKNMLDVPALPGSAVSLERYDLGRGGGAVGKACIWSTVEGIYLGLVGGLVKDLTSKHYQVNGIVDGYAFIRDLAGYRQYIYLGYAGTGEGEAEMHFTEPLERISMTGG